MSDGENQVVDGGHVAALDGVGGVGELSGHLLKIQPPATDRRAPRKRTVIRPWCLMLLARGVLVPNDALQQMGQASGRGGRGIGFADPPNDFPTTSSMA